MLKWFTKCILNDGGTQLEVKLEKDTVWLTQSQMAELFGRERSVIARNI